MFSNEKKYYHEKMNHRQTIIKWIDSKKNSQKN